MSKPTALAYNVQDTAAMLAIPASTLYRALKNGTVDKNLRPIKVGNIWRFPAAAVHTALGVEDAT